MVFQPAGESCRIGIGQQFDRPVGIKVDEDGFEVLAFAEGPLIDAEAGWCLGRRQGSGAQEPENGCGPDRHALTLGNAGGAVASHLQTKLALFVGQAQRAACRWGEGFREWLREGTALTGVGCTHKAAHAEQQLDGNASPRQVSGPALVVGVDFCGRGGASRTGGGLL